MPDGYDEAADLWLPMKKIFVDWIAIGVQYRMVGAVEGETFAFAKPLIFTTKGSRRHRRASCTVRIILFASAKISNEELEEMLNMLVVPAVDNRLRPVFKQDRRDWQKADEFARQAQEVDLDEVNVEAVDETTFEHLEFEIDDEPLLRLVRQAS